MAGSESDVLMKALKNAEWSAAVFRSYLSWKKALITDQSAARMVTMKHVPGSFGVCQFWMNWLPSYRSVVPPVFDN